ncbi:MAG: gamma-glutamylcyclotransferase family protein [Candidatus Competibacterales bacterium]
MNRANNPWRWRYFAYGSNLHPPRLTARLGAVAPLGVAALHGHQFQFHKWGKDGSAKADARWTGRSSHRVWGALYGLSDGQRRELDAIEGLGKGYQRAWLAVAGEVGFFYRATSDAWDPELKPFDWYRALVVAGGRYHGLPAAYLASIEAFEAVVDPDRERSASHWALLAAYGG